MRRSRSSRSLMSSVLESTCENLPSFTSFFLLLFFSFSSRCISLDASIMVVVTTPMNRLITTSADTIVKKMKKIEETNPRAFAEARSHGGINKSSRSVRFCAV